MASRGGGIYCNVKVGSAGNGWRNAAYITRASGTLADRDAVRAYNYPSYVTQHNNTYEELRQHLAEYNRQVEEDEMRRPYRGAGEARTHYRVQISFENRTDTERAAALA
ncbi:MAG: hypothetical protein ACREDR_43205, partial [Blastocatellia bacterium]